MTQAGITKWARYLVGILLSRHDTRVAVLPAKCENCEHVSWPCWGGQGVGWAGTWVGTLAGRCGGGAALGLAQGRGPWVREPQGRAGPAADHRVISAGAAPALRRGKEGDSRAGHPNRKSPRGGSGRSWEGGGAGWGVGWSRVAPERRGSEETPGSPRARWRLGVRASALWLSRWGGGTPRRGSGVGRVQGQPEEEEEWGWRRGAGRTHRAAAARGGGAPGARGTAPARAAAPSRAPRGGAWRRRPLSARSRSRSRSAPPRVT